MNPNEPHDTANEGVRIIGAEEAGSPADIASAQLSAPQSVLSRADATFAPADMPHWADPPTGEVPAAILGENLPANTPMIDLLDEVDDVPRLGALDTARSDASDIFSFDFYDEPYRDVSAGVAAEPVSGEPTQLVAIGDVDDEHDLIDLISMEATDDEAVDAEAPVDGEMLVAAGAVDAATTARSGSRVRNPMRKASGRASLTAPVNNTNGPTNRVAAMRNELTPSGPGRDMTLATIVGAVLGAIAFAAIVFGGPRAVVFLVFIATALAGVELFDALRRSSLQPITALGLVSISSMVLGSYWKGERAVPLVLTLTLIGALAWHLLGVTRARPAVSIGSTLLGAAWVGMLGASAALLLRLPNRSGLALLAIAAVAAIVYDVAGLLVGSKFGRRALAPSISPNKTVEGLAAGMFAAFLVTILLGSKVHPAVGHGRAMFAIAIAMALMAPLGDLVQSMVKRDLGIKDSGTLLPGHGGVFDRFDSMLFVMPAMYYLATALNIF